MMISSDFNIVLGDRIKTARRYAGVWQLDLAKACGISQGHLSRIECGHASPSLELLRKISSVLKYDLNVEFRITER